MPSSRFPITSQTLNSSSSTITFSNITDAYTDLVLVFSARTDDTNAVDNTVLFRLNGNSSSVYSMTMLRGNGSTAIAASNTGTSINTSVNINGSASTSNTFSNVAVYIPNYLSSRPKQLFIDNSQENNATTAYRILSAGLFNSSSPVTSITLTSSVNFIAGSSFYLYGVSRVTQSSTSNAPTIGTATDTGTGTSATVSFTPSGSGSTADIYKVTSTPGSFTGYGYYSPIVVSGLSNSTSYTFRVAGVNNKGTGTASSASNSITTTIGQGSYLTGGDAGSVSGYTSAISKITFATDTHIVLSATMLAADGLSGCANSGTAGYAAGGYLSGTSYTTTNKLTFSNESNSTLGTGLSQGRYGLSGFANSGTAGYFAGGVSDASTTIANIVDKFAFSNDSRSTLGTGLSYRPFSCSAFANSGTAGYVGGGYDYTPGADPIFPAFFNKFAFSNDSRTTLADRIVHAGTSRTYMAGFANSGTAGYLAGNVSSTKNLTKFVFSNETSSTITSGLAVNTYRAVASAKVGSFGIITPGQDFGIQKYAFSTDTASLIADQLNFWHTAAAGFANSGSI